MRIRNGEGYDPEADDEYEVEFAAVLFARDGEMPSGKPLARFSDLLTQAVIARRGRKDFTLNSAPKCGRSARGSP